MKKTLAGIVLSCVLAASLTACGGSNNSASTSAAETSAAAGESTEAATTESGDKVVRIAAVDPQVALHPQQRLLQQLAAAHPQQQPLRAATRLYVSQQ